MTYKTSKLNKSVNIGMYYPGTRRFFFLVGGEATTTSREPTLLALTNVSRRWRARRPLASRVGMYGFGLKKGWRF